MKVRLGGASVAAATGMIPKSAKPYVCNRSHPISWRSVSWRQATPNPVDGGSDPPSTSVVMLAHLSKPKENVDAHSDSSIALLAQQFPPLPNFSDGDAS